MCLVNRLRSSNITQLWWTISSAHNHGYITLMSLYYRTMKMSGRGPGCTEQYRREPRRRTYSQCGKGRTAFVVKDMYLDGPTLCQCNSKRSAATPGSDHCVSHPLT